MDASLSAPTESQQENLWSSILNSVSSSRSIPSKQVLLLGEPSSGKSTLAAALLQKNVEIKDEKNDFALGYDWTTVKDDVEEDVLARLSVYSVPSSSSTYLSLLPHFMPPTSSLQNTVVVIILDWMNPWSFLQQLQLWFSWVEQWSRGDGSRDNVIATEESRERLQHYWQHFLEPGSDSAPSNSTLNNVVLPLGPGVLTHNMSGVSMVVVCTKSDLIDESSDSATNTSAVGGMVKSKGGDWDEKTDTIMQILRTICLKYGAALFYTSLLPQTLVFLRHYILHVLFSLPSPVPGLHSNLETVTTFRNPFPLTQKPNTLDRDRIFVPMGWDSWGKIAVIREGFDSKSWGDGWDLDINTEKGDFDPDRSGTQSAIKLYSEMVLDRGKKLLPLPPLSSPVPEQIFLAKNYDENSRKSDKDPRGAFRSPNDGGTNTSGIVGPLGSSSFSLPSVERALVEMEGGMNESANFSDNRKISRKDGRPSVAASSAGQSSSPSSHSHQRPTNTSPASGNSPDLRVLHEFFQSLLVPGGRGGGVATPTSARTNSSNTEAAAPALSNVSTLGDGNEAIESSPGI